MLNILIQILSKRPKITTTNITTASITTAKITTTISTNISTTNMTPRCQAAGGLEERQPGDNKTILTVIYNFLTNFSMQSCCFFI